MMDRVQLPEEIKSVMQNGIPAQLVSCSAQGVPNATDISQVYFVDREHVALSYQFFSKTIRNIRENPHACVLLFDMARFASWLLHLEYVRSETEGPIFDQMDMTIEAIASATGMSGIFKLKAADIYKVKSMEKIEHGQSSD